MKAVQTHTLSALNLPGSTTELEWIYNGLDCALTYEIFEILEPQLDAVSRPTYAFSKALQAPALEMKLRGIKVDLAQRAEVIALYERQLAKLEDQLNRLLAEGIGTALNWRSPLQLQRLFYDILGIPPQQKRGKTTVDREALEKMEAYFYARPIISHILTMRDIAKKIGVLKTDIDRTGACVQITISLELQPDGSVVASATSEQGLIFRISKKDLDAYSLLTPG